MARKGLSARNPDQKGRFLPRGVNNWQRSALVNCSPAGESTRYRRLRRGVIYATSAFNRFGTHYARPPNNQVLRISLCISQSQFVLDHKKRRFRLGLVSI